MILIGDTRIKIKFEEYKRLHYMKSNLNVKTIFDLIRRINTPIEEILKNIPDENHSWFQELLKEISDQYDQINDEMTKKFTSIYIPGMARKDFASVVNKLEPKFKAFMFNLLDNKSIKELTYNLINMHIEELEKKFNHLV